MSWSVSRTGKPGEIIPQLEKDFSYPLAQPPAGLSDQGERDTVELVKDLVDQCLGTFDPTKDVSVSANGHISFDDYNKKTGARQTIHIAIEPK